ncbi:MAG: multidrug efflux MATE transporter NorM, partial [Neisseriaceae bacterium]|nr:multidrug efflux MATE transporter NorM [Neisseriaceae bacterium]
MQTKKRFFYELYLILVIALPMMIAQVAQVGTGFVDTLMAGHVSRGDLAAVGFGSSVFAT